MIWSIVLVHLCLLSVSGKEHKQKKGGKFYLVGTRPHSAQNGKKQNWLVETETKKGDFGQSPSWAPRSKTKTEDTGTETEKGDFGKSPSWAPRSKTKTEDATEDKALQKKLKYLKSLNRNMDYKLNRADPSPTVAGSDMKVDSEEEDEWGEIKEIEGLEEEIEVVTPATPAPKLEDVLAAMRSEEVEWYRSLTKKQQEEIQKRLGRIYWGNMQEMLSAAKSGLLQEVLADQLKATKKGAILTGADGIPPFPEIPKTLKPKH